MVGGQRIPKDRKILQTARPCKYGRVIYNRRKNENSLKAKVDSIGLVRFEVGNKHRSRNWLHPK